MTRLHLSRLVFGRPPRDVYELHQALWQAFPSGDRSFLFRADRAADDGGPVRLKVLVQSTVEPDWAPLGDRLFSHEHKVKEWRWEAGGRMRFLLRANPTIRRKGSRDVATRDLAGEAFRAVAGHRVPLRGIAERSAWLSRKAAAAGFRVEVARQQNSTTAAWSRGSTRGKHEGVDFEGLLVVEDPVRFGAAVTEGIGTAKAFGHGLLSLASCAES